MRYAMIMAGGSGTRLWPMSRHALPKQLIPFIHGKSLLQIADLRLDGLIPQSQRYVCAGQTHREAILSALPDIDPSRYLGEPMGRDTLAAVGFGAAIVAKHDPDAVMAVFTADHVIEPIDKFQQIVTKGFELAEAHPNTLVTFGITPSHAATGYGYLQLGATLQGESRIVEKFKEKPVAETAQQYFQAGPSRYLWNSGMFVWRAATLLDCIKRFEPMTHAGLMEIAGAWDTAERDSVVERVYPTLKKISVDFAVMEPASRDAQVKVAAVPMPLTWLDVGSWPAFAKTCDRDTQGNAIAAPNHLLLDTTNALVASDDDEHLIATIGCNNMIIVHTKDATLVCRADRAEDIKKLQAKIAERWPDKV